MSDLEPKFDTTEDAATQPEPETQATRDEQVGRMVRMLLDKGFEVTIPTHGLYSLKRREPAAE